MGALFLLINRTRPGLSAAQFGELAALAKAFYAAVPADVKELVSTVAKKGGTPIVSLTAYTTPIARLVDEHCDIALVGDSVGMVMHGLPSTLGVTTGQSGPAALPNARQIGHVTVPAAASRSSPRIASKTPPTWRARWRRGAPTTRTPSPPACPWPTA